MARCVNESGRVLLMTEKSEENPPMTCLLISEIGGNARTLVVLFRNQGKYNYIYQWHDYYEVTI